jgi:hypothetical protein
MALAFVTDVMLMQVQGTCGRNRRHRRPNAVAEELGLGMNRRRWRFPYSALTVIIPITFLTPV